MHRLIFSTGNVILSLILGALALAFVGINAPETLDRLITVAGTVKGWIVGAGLSPKYNVWVRLLLEEKQLVFMFFTIAMRILMSLATWIGLSIWDRARA